MNMKMLNRFTAVAVVLLLMITVINPVTIMASETDVDLKTADSFAVIAGSTITTTGGTTIDGDIGLDPGSQFIGQETAVINGEIHINDAVAIQAKVDLQAAYLDAAGRTLNTTSSELGGRTLIPGVYSSASSFQITGTLTLDGQNDPNAIFIFQTGSTLTTASGSKVVLINGANYKNIFWQVGSSATLGTNSEFSGSILSALSITATTGASIKGRLLAMGAAVTLDTNKIINSQTASLTVIKVVTGDTDGLSLPTFEITVTGPENFSETKNFAPDESFTWDELVPGEYTVIESRTGLSSEWDVSGEGEVQVLTDQENVVTITNDYTERRDRNPEETTPEETTPEETTPVETTTEIIFPEMASIDVVLNGSLTVEKIVTGNTDGMTLPVFEITVTGPESFSVTKTFGKNESFTWDDLKPGVYTVTENHTGLSDEWTVTGEGDVQVIADQTTLASITNDYEADEIIATIPDTIPETGQSTDFRMAMFLGIGALLFAGVGVLLAIKRKRFNA